MNLTPASRCSAAAGYRARWADNVPEGCSAALRMFEHALSRLLEGFRVRSAITSVVVALLLVAPLSAGARSSDKVWRIGFLGAQSPDVSATYLAAFRTGLRDLGYVEGTNLVLRA